MKNPILKKYLDPANIRLWIVLLFLVRLFGITNPPLEHAHDWRMVTTNMYARNFLETDPNILYSRIDMAGDLTGITAKEFPLYNYLIYLVSLVFGWQHWYGRLISLLISSAGTYYFYLILRRFFSEKHAFASTMVLMLSIWFAYSRKIMPDTFSISLVLAGLYYGFRYLDSGRFYRLVLYFLLGTAGVLSKIPSIYIFIILVIPILDRNISMDRKALVVAASMVLLAVNLLWYLYWVPYVVRTYGYVHYPEREFTEGARQILSDPAGVVKRFYWSAYVSYISFAVFLGGLGLAIFRKEGKILWPFGLMLASFFLFVLKAGSSFTIHNYYIIPFVPAMALVSGYLLSSIRKRWVFPVVIIAISLEGVANQQHEFFIPTGEEYKLQLEAIADSISEPEDLIAISGGHNPQQLYFTHRKGWALNDEDMKDSLKLESIREKGAKYLFINKNSPEQYVWNDSVVYEDDHYTIYDLGSGDR